MAGTSLRKLPTTGYWIFVRNTSRWFADQFLRNQPSEVFWTISYHHRHDFKAHQVGVLRLNHDRRTARLRNGEPKTRKGIYALLEVTGSPQEIADPNPDPSRYYADPAEASELKWRVRAKIIKNLIETPVLTAALPTERAFQYLHRALQTATIPLSQGAFEFVVDQVGGVDEPHEMALLSVDDAAKIREFEDRYAGREPIITEVHSRRIERGEVGRWVKRYRRYRCQVCSALGREPIAFEDRNGIGFAEAHHVIPVSQGAAGSLSYLNIMVLCPNHHRQGITVGST